MNPKMVGFEDERLRLEIARNCILYDPPPPDFEQCAMLDALRSAAAGASAISAAIPHTLAQPAAPGQRVVTLVASDANAAPAMRSDDAVRRQFVGSVLRLGVGADAEVHVVIGADVCPGQAEGSRLRVDFHLHAPVAAEHATGEHAELGVWRAPGSESKSASASGYAMEEDCEVLDAASPHFVRVASRFTRRAAVGARGGEGGNDTAIFSGDHASVAFSTSPALALALTPVEVGDEVALRVLLAEGGAAAARYVYFIYRYIFCESC